MVVVDAKRSRRARLCPLWGSLVGKGGDPEAEAHSGNAHRGGRFGVNTAEGALLPSPRPESALRRWGRHRAPLAHFGVRWVPWHLPGDFRLAAGQDSCPSDLAWWDSTAARGDVPARSPSLHT